jgi:prevent-host-death family protein
MHLVGIKELKNRLTYYLKLTKKGGRIVVTDRGSPVAVLHSLDQIEESAGVEERLASLGKKGMVRLPTKARKLPPFAAVMTEGKSASEIIIKDHSCPN